MTSQVHLPIVSLLLLLIVMLTRITSTCSIVSLFYCPSHQQSLGCLGRSARMAP